MTGLTAPARSSHRFLSIATFHRVLSEADQRASPYPFPGLVVTPEELDAFLIYLVANFDCGTLAAQHRRHVSGEITDRPLLALTFDDGQYDNYRNARPVLARHQVKASFFVPVEAVKRQVCLWHDRLGFAVLSLLDQRGSGGWERLYRVLANAGISEIDPRNSVGSIAQCAKRLGSKARMKLVEALEASSSGIVPPAYARPMKLEEILELSSDGHEIGSHSMTHCLMTECDDDTLTYELSVSRFVLESLLDRKIESFCYPNGNSDLRTAIATEKAGYSRAVTTACGSNERKSDRFRLRRYDMVAKHLTDSEGVFVPALLAYRMSPIGTFHPVEKLRNHRSWGMQRRSRPAVDKFAQQKAETGI
jgi:peptidoglycan/xylan/chitin deacetylase (PgdA/CDA1 family)